MTTLTPRETEILELLAQGNQDKQIARALEISAKTVSAHNARIYYKLGIRQESINKRSVAIAKALMSGLVKSSSAALCIFIAVSVQHVVTLQTVTGLNV